MPEILLACFACAYKTSDVLGHLTSFLRETFDGVAGFGKGYLQYLSFKRSKLGWLAILEEMKVSVHVLHEIFVVLVPFDLNVDDITQVNGLVVTPFTACAVGV